jgi:mxaJ protein
VRGFPVYGDYRTSAPLSPIMTAVANGDVDVAIVWGPTAGYFALRERTPLTLSPVLLDSKLLTQPMTFDIAVGVRKSDVALATAINAALSKRHADISSILRHYGVPLTGQQTAASESR